MRILKYPVPIEDVFSIDLPEDTQILTVKAQYDSPNIWALVYPDRPLKTRNFRLYGTGHGVPDDLSQVYVGTFMLGEGTFVGHLFEIIH